MYKKLAVVSVVLLILGVLVGFLAFPKLLSVMIKKQITLKPGTETRRMWEKAPIYLNFAVYVFNVTNPAETQKGGKPRLQEVGPFMFEEWKDKYNLEDDEKEDAVSYNMRNTFIFRPDLGLSGEELITLPHPLLQVFAISIKRDKAAMLKMIVEGLEIMFAPKSPFVTAPFMDLFYRGIEVDCSSDNFAAKAICLNFHTGAVKGSVKVDETHFKFSLMGGNNHTDAGRFKVARGSVGGKARVGDVILYDDETEQNVWEGDECNRFRGSDSTIFAPQMQPNEGLWAFSADLCRSLGPKFQKRDTYNGIPIYRYAMDFGDVKNEPENHCFCKSYPDDCPPKGTMELSACSEAPMLASMPHFLHGDPQLLAAVEGLRPLEEKHGIRVDFEIISGSVLSAAKRLQFNLAVEPIQEMAVMRDLRPLVMPLFWVEEAIDLNTTFTDIIKNKVFRTIKINTIFKWTATVLGAVGCAFSAYMLYYRQASMTSVVAYDVQSMPPPTSMRH